MKVKVLIPFNDKYTGKEYKKDDVIEVSAERFNEITRKGRFIEAVDETAAKAKEAKK